MTKELIDCGEIFEGCDIQPFSVIYINTTEDMRQCLHNVLYTFKCLLKNSYEEERKIQHQKYYSYFFWIKSRPLNPIGSSVSSSQITQKKSSDGNSSTTTASVVSGKMSSKTEHSPRPSREEVILKLETLYSYFEHDLYEVMISRLVEILTDMVEITIQESVLIPGQEIFQTAQGIDRELGFLVNLNCLGERIVRDCVKAYITHFLTFSRSSYGSQIKEKLQDSCRSIWSTIFVSPSLSFQLPLPPEESEITAQDSILPQTALSSDKDNQG